MKDFIIAHLGEFITALVAGFSGWFFGRKKQNAEAESVVIDNDTKTVELYQRVLDDLAIRYEKKYIEITELYERKIELLKKSNEQLSVQLQYKKDLIADLEIENKTLKEKIKWQEQ